METNLTVRPEPPQIGDTFSPGDSDGSILRGGQIRFNGITETPRGEAYNFTRLHPNYEGETFDMGLDMYRNSRWVLAPENPKENGQ